MWGHERRTAAPEKIQRHSVRKEKLVQMYISIRVLLLKNVYIFVLDDATIDVIAKEKQKERRRQNKGITHTALS